MKKILAILFILLGIGLFAYRPIRDIWYDYEKDKILEMYEKNLIYTDEDSYSDDSQSESDSVSDFYKYFISLEEMFKSKNPSEALVSEASIAVNNDKSTNELEDIIGIINIAKINAKLPIKSYFSEKEVKSSVGHLPESAKPGEIGNCIIAGHRARAKGRLFNRLDELEAGDTISITYNSQNFEYMVIDKMIVEPTNTSVLDVDEDDYILTLITCHPVITNTHRLVIRASLIK